MRVRLDFDKRQLRGCYGLSMEDGTRYTVNSSGTVTIDRKDHLKALAKGGKVDFSTNTPQWIEAKTEGTICESCGHHGFKWNQVCPKCLGRMRQFDPELDVVKKYWPR